MQAAPYPDPLLRSLNPGENLRCLQAVVFLSGPAQLASHCHGSEAPAFTQTPGGPNLSGVATDCSAEPTGGRRPSALREPSSRPHFGAPGQTPPTPPSRLRDAEDAEREAGDVRRGDVTASTRTVKRPQGSFRRPASLGDGDKSPPIGALGACGVPRLPGNPRPGRSTAARQLVSARACLAPERTALGGDEKACVGRSLQAAEAGSMASTQAVSALAEGKPDGSAGLTDGPSAPSARLGSWAKDHCDYLLDSIDAQLSQLQAPGSGARVQGNSSDGAASLETSVAADLGGCSADRSGRASAGEEPSSGKEENSWRQPAHLPISERPPPGGWSRSDSVCTEDLAAKFKGGLVDLLWSSEEQEEDAFPGGNLSRGLRPLEYTTRCPVENTGPSQLLADFRTTLDSSSVCRQDIAQPLNGASLEELSWALAGHSEEPPSIYIWNPRRTLGSLGETISGLSQKGFNETPRDAGCAKGGSARKGVFWPLDAKDTPVGLGLRNSGESAFLGPREDLEGSSQLLQDAHESSNSPLLIEDLGPSRPLQTADVAALGTAVWGAEAPWRTDQGKRQSGCPRDLSGVASLSTLKAAHRSCGPSPGPSGPPQSLDPLVAWKTDQRQRAALLGLGTWGSRKPLGVSSEGYVEQRRPQGRDLPHPESHAAAVGLMEWIPLKSFDGVTVGSDLDSARMEKARRARFSRAFGCWQGSGPSPRKPHSLQRHWLRDLSSSDEEEEEEEEGELVRFWRIGSPKRRTPSRAADPHWKATKSQACGGDEPSAGTTQHRGDPLAEDVVASLVKLEESMVKLQQDLELEEEKLSQKKAQIREAEVSLCSVLQQKKHMTLELETLREALEESQEEAQRLEWQAKENRGKVDEARADLVLLGHKREACLRELPRLEEELSTLRRKCSRYGVLQAEVSRLVTEREELKTQVGQLEDSLVSLKHQLRKCKSELTSVHETAGVQNAQLQQVAQAAGELEGRIKGLERRISALQETLSAKDLELARLRQAVVSLESEKEAQGSALEGLKQEHKRQLERLQREALRKEEMELARLREELQDEKQQALRELAESTEQAKARTLQEQAATFQKDIDHLHKTIEDQDNLLSQQKQAMEQQAQALKLAGEEMVQNSLLREQKKWEADARAALQMQREALEEQHRRMQTDLQGTLEKEKEASLALQDTTAELHKKTQALESQARLFQSEKRAAMQELQALLQEEKAEALRRLREELEQARMQEREQMRVRLQQMEDELRLLQAEQSQTSFREKESQAHTEWADHSLAREVALACQRFQDLLPKTAAEAPSIFQMLARDPTPFASGRALQALQEVSEETRRYLWDLRRQTEAQKVHILQIQREKESQLRQLREELHSENQAALEALKEQLVQEHMKDMAALQRRRLRESQVAGDPVLHQPLREKVGEQRAIRKNLAPQKDETASQLALQLQEELDTELQKCLSRGRSMDSLRTLGAAQLESSLELPNSMGRGGFLHPVSISPPLVSPAAPWSGQRIFSTPKLLHHLQSRIRALRAENAQYCSGSLDDLSGLREGLSKAYRSKRPLSSDRSSSQLHSGK
ncbi:uncharacterized protein LOC128338020 [Hemicordylus capensis]|uniref:uncharacterized protein LOC128338020 n=1 Tax=Hemicordylus capensis TaxID=884348 RepID=UPI00230345A3|nr:uncharacterized protein LOC128338020 [Hemicordylus capensis]